MSEKEKEMEIRSEEVQDVLGDIPHWILRWGITIVASIVVILLVGSAFFQYPDIITTEMTLTCTNPPTALVSMTSGKIRELYVSDKQIVESADYLAVIENSAFTKDILKLKSYLQAFVLYNDSIPQLPTKDLQLGSIQSIYSNFYYTLFEYCEFLRLHYYEKKIDFMRKRIYEQQKYTQMITSQKPIVEAQEELQYNQLRRDSLLNQKKLISNETFEGTKSQYLQNRLSVQNIYSTIQNTKMQIIIMKESLLDMENQYREKKNELVNGIKTKIAQLLAEIQAWELTYVLKSPIRGEVTFTNYWSINQNVTAGEIIFNVVPTSNEKIIGKAKMPATRSGKVKMGQRVNIRFAPFPDSEYGMVNGLVKLISSVASTDPKIGKYYTVEIEFPKGLYTTYNKCLPYLPDMQAQADIITEDISLLKRLFLPLKKIWKERMALN